MVKIEKRAIALIKQDILRHEGVETGGILLGYRNDHNCFIIMEAIDGGYNAVHKSNRFKYDYLYAKHLSQIISELYDPQLDVIGVWHTHVNVYNPPFSIADKEMHLRLVNICKNDIVSLLIQIKDEEYYASVYKISKDCEIKEEIIIDDSSVL